MSERVMAGKSAGRATGAGPRPPRGAPASLQVLERVVGGGAEQDGKLQRQFRRLLQKIEGLKQRLRAWKEARPGIDAQISMYSALYDRYTQLAHDLVLVLERAYHDPALSKTDRSKMSAMITELSGDLLEQGRHEDLKPLYNRHSRGNFDAETAAASAASAESLRSMMEMFGVDFGGADVSSMEKLQAFTDAQVRAEEEEAAASEARRARRKKSARQAASEAKREDEQRSASKALQDVYRSLAKALHPDREQDPVERERKTEVMRDVNVAYEARDLLRLLEIQLALEQVEPERADAIAEDRLRHYNRILDEQARQLTLELEELELPFRMQLGLPPTARMGPPDVLSQLRLDSEELREAILEIERDTAAVSSIAGLKAWLKAHVRRRRRDDRGRDMFR